jgi:hypothetical protein
MICDIWKTTITPGAQLRRNHLTWDHFELDSYKKMRVFLAVHVMSQSTINMVTEHCNQNPNEFRLEDYKPMLEIFGAMDRLVDIMNAYHSDQLKKSGGKRGIEKINHPQHRHVIELLDTLRLFEEWRLECGRFTTRFVTWQTYQDLKWLVLGVACMAATYLKEDKSIEMDTGRAGSDVMEHFFGATRGKNSNPDAMQADEVAGRHASTNAVIDGRMFKTRPTTNASHANTDYTAYTAPIPKKPRKS